VLAGAAALSEAVFFFLEAAVMKAPRWETDEFTMNRGTKHTG
jgi:hypothetical protein